MWNACEMGTLLSKAIFKLIIAAFTLSANSWTNLFINCVTCTFVILVNRYRRCTGFGHPFKLQSTIKNTPRLKCNIFFTPNFELKILLLIAPIAKNKVQSEVGFLKKKPWGPKSYAEHLTWAHNNFIVKTMYYSLYRMMFNALTVRWVPF